LLARIDDWHHIAKVRGEYFKDIRPVDTVFEVKGFINKEWLVEIEVDAMVFAGLLNRRNLGDSIRGALQ